MTTTRRSFMRHVGATLGALLASSCTCYAPLTYTPVSSPVPYPTCYVAPVEPPTPEAAAEWEALRACWLDLQDTRLISADGAAFSVELRNRHADALGALRTGGQLDANVAAAIAVAFDEAVTHVQRKMATCYEPLEPGEPNPYTSREELTTQAAALAEMAERSRIDPVTVARAQEALERDMAWLARFQGGQKPGEPESIEATPAEVEAARVLVELLLNRE